MGAGPAPGWSWVISLAVNAVAFGLFLWLASPRFQTNDDVALMRIAAGISSGEPSPLLVVSNLLLGALLTQLYLLEPGFNWYAAQLLAVHFASMSALLWTFLWLGPPILGSLLFLLFLLQFELRLLLELQFTSTAAVAGLAGIVLLVPFEAAARTRRPAALALGTGLVVLGALIRIESLLLVSLLASPLAAYSLCRGRSRRVVACLAASFALSAAAVAIDRCAYRGQPEWSDYLDYLGTRVRLEHSPAMKALIAPLADPNAAAVLDRVGWSPNDALMYTRWFYAHERVYARDRLEAILDAFPERRGFSPRDLPSFAARLASEPSTGLAIAFDLLLAFALARRRGPRMALAGLAAVSLACGFLAHSWLKGLPDHVLLSAQAALGGLALAFALGRSEGIRGSARAVGPRPAVLLSLLVSVSALLWVGVPALRGLDQANRLRQRDYARLSRTLARDLEPLETRPTLVYWGAAFPFEWSPLFEAEVAERTAGIWLGWETHSPHYAEGLRRRGIADLYEALIRRDDLLLVSRASNLPLFATFIREHYGIEIGAEIVSRFDPSPATGEAPLVVARTSRVRSGTR